MFVSPECGAGNIDRTPRIVQASYRTLKRPSIASLLKPAKSDPSGRASREFWERGPRFVLTFKGDVRDDHRREKR